MVDSREANEGRSIRRRRECEDCTHRFTTFEKVETANFLVVKKDGSREGYDRSKVERGIWKACEKRPVTQEQISTMLDRLEEVWSASGKVPGEIIGREMHALKVIDEFPHSLCQCIASLDVEEFRRSSIGCLVVIVFTTFLMAVTATFFNFKGGEFYGFK